MVNGFIILIFTGLNVTTKMEAYLRSGRTGETGTGHVLCVKWNKGNHLKWRWLQDSHWISEADCGNKNLCNKMRWEGLEAPWRTKCWNLLRPTCFGELLHMICHHAVTVEPSLCPGVWFRWSFSISHCCKRKEPRTGSRLLLRAEPFTCQLSSDGTCHTGYWHTQQIKNNFQLQILGKITMFLGIFSQVRSFQEIIPKLWGLIFLFFLKKKFQSR